MNSRGQNLDWVNKNCLMNLKYENIFKKYIDKLLKINIDKHNDKYNHYDFSLDDIHNIEYKGVYYSLNKNNTATSNKGVIIENVMIGYDKIKYYKKMKDNDNQQRFYLFYGFYDVDDIKAKIIKIVYRYIDITDILTDIMKDYKVLEWYNKNHYLIPIKDLQIITDGIFKKQ